MERGDVCTAAPHSQESSSLILIPLLPQTQTQLFGTFTSITRYQLLELIFIILKITVQIFWVFLSLVPHSVCTSVVLRPKLFVILFEIMPTKDKTTKFQFPHAQTHQYLCFPGAEFCVSYSRWAKVISPVLET